MLSHTVSNSYMPVSSFDRSENDGLLLGSASQHRNMREYLPQGWATNHQHENTKTHKQRLCLFFQITEVINGGLKCKLNPYWSRRGRARVCLSWAVVCAIIIFGPLAKRTCSCMQRHEHQSTTCVKSVVDCKTHICDVHWARSQFVRQAGKEEGRTSCCCL